MNHYIPAVILAGCCIVYGILVLMVGSGTGFFAVRFGLAALILVTAVLAGSGKGAAGTAAGASAGAWTAKWIPVMELLVRILWILIAAAIAVTWSLIATEFRDKGKPGLDYIIVLGAQVNSDGPSRSLECRLDAARDYLDANPDTVCIVSGGQGWNEPEAEAAVMKRWLVEHGISEDRILVEDQSRDTHENIVNSRAIIQEDLPVGIVTNDFHVFRGVHLAKKAGFLSAAGIAAKSTRLYLLNNMLRETLGIIKDFVCGNLA